MIEIDYILVSCITSVVLNIFLVWYSIRLIRELTEVSTSIQQLFIDVDIFYAHLKRVYELEMFYGDQTLSNLLAHTRELRQRLNEYKVMFALLEDEEEEENLVDEPTSNEEA